MRTIQKINEEVADPQKKSDAEGEKPSVRHEKVVKNRMPRRIGVSEKTPAVEPKESPYKNSVPGKNARQENKDPAPETPKKMSPETMHDQQRH